MPVTRFTLNHRRRSGGFALIAVLGLLMLLSLVAAFVSDYAEQRLEQSYQLQRQLQGHGRLPSSYPGVHLLIARRALLTIDHPPGTAGTIHHRPLVAGCPALQRYSFMPRLMISFMISVVPP